MKRSSHLQLSIISIGIGFALLIWLLLPFVDWAILKATWIGTSKQDCTQGACWAMIHARFKQFVYGFYPIESRWRVDLSLILLCLQLIILGLFKIPLLLRILTSLLIWTLILYLLHGGFILPIIPTSAWGGLFLTLFLAFGSMFCAFPISLLLALGRHSSLVFIKALCIIFIEIIRGVPLITILFMASVMLPLLFTNEMDVDKLLRAFIGITLFQAAYLAEVIRGGLNSLPKGQYEASYSLGLGDLYTMWFIILPQALRVVIPGIVNNFIALFKDTTLVLMVGIFDFLGMVQLATTDPRWLGSALEAYLFCAFVYWIFCFSMSLYSKYLEKRFTVSFA